MQILPDYLEKNGVNQAVQYDVKQILTYFNLSAPLHHDDEEKDFFPALAKCVPQAQNDIDRLETQHVALHKNWDLLSAQLEQLLKGERENIDRDLIAAFVAGYDSHIALEDPLFELERNNLSENELKAMGKIMSERRKI